MHILLITTGGTIAGRSSESGVALSGAPLPYPEQYRREIDGQTCFTVRSPYEILSENLSPAHWEALFAPLLKEAVSAFDGILITHGSDTLAYTAAMAGLLLSHLPIPVVLTGADKPPARPDSNGWDNFCCAVDLIRQGVRGVYAAYRNPSEGAVTVFAWNEIRSACPQDDRFQNLAPAPLGTWKSGALALCRAPRTEESALLSKLPKLRRSVQMLFCYPGMDFRTVALAPGTGSVLLKLYHSGTACVEGKGGAAEFVRRLRWERVPCYLLGVKRRKEDRYASLQALGGGILLPASLTAEAAYAALLLSVNDEGLPVERAMNRAIEAD